MGLLAMLVLAFLLEAQAGPSVLTELMTIGLFAAALFGSAVVAQPARVSRLAFMCGSLVWCAATTASVLGLPVQGLATALTGVILLGSLQGTFLWLTKHGRADRDLLLGAIYGYLLLIMAWAFLYVQIERMHPGSFNLPEGADVWTTLLFFSAVTMTTLGYGDVLPLSNTARMVAAFEAIVGVLYVAVLIGGIVGTLQNWPKK